MGCCYVELEQYEEAREYGLRSVAAAEEIADEEWQMYANVLVALAECNSFIISLNTENCVNNN